MYPSPRSRASSRAPRVRPGVWASHMARRTRMMRNQPAAFRPGREQEVSASRLPRLGFSAGRAATFTGWRESGQQVAGEPSTVLSVTPGTDSRPQIPVTHRFHSISMRCTRSGDEPGARSRSVSRATGKSAPRRILGTIGPTATSSPRPCRAGVGPEHRAVPGIEESVELEAPHNPFHRA